MDSVHCPSCDILDNGRSLFCSGCGEMLRLSCPACSSVNERSDNYCSNCGYALLHPVYAAERWGQHPTRPQVFHRLGERAQGDLKGQRRQVTVLFTDIVGSTEVAEKIGEEATFVFMQRTFADWIHIIHRLSGTVQEFTGDGIMALFGVPVSLEDASLRACRAAIEIRDSMPGLVAELRATHRVEPRVRIGIHAGPIIVGEIGTDKRMEFTAIGDTANLASRLERLAEPDSILMSGEVYRTVSNQVAVSFLGEQALKGKSRRQPIYRLDALEYDPARFNLRIQKGLGRLIGRRGEIDELEHVWRRSREGRTGFVLVVGDPGIGKSRIVYEFCERLQRAEGIIALQGHCSTDGSSTAFLPFVEVVRQAFGIGVHADKRSVEASVREGLERLDLPVPQHLMYIVNLLGLTTRESLGGLDAETIGARTRETLQLLLKARCRQTPVLLVIEDLQWMDSASQRLLEWIAELKTSPLLVLCTSRPSIDFSWIDQTQATLLFLSGLPQSGTIELLNERFGNKLAKNVIDFLAAKCEGNPLFAEEMASYVVESGGAGSDEAAPETLPSGLPGTIEALLLQRVDELPPGLRRFVQVASIVGGLFDAELIARVLPHRESVHEYLHELQRRELIFEEPSRERRQYRFKHVLIQEAVYNTLLQSERASLHLAVGEAIEDADPERTSEQVDILAHHFSRSADAGKALRYLTMAGQKSLRLYSISEARERFGQALALAEAQPGLCDLVFRAELARNAALATFLMLDAAGAIRILENNLADVERLEDPSRLSHYLSDLGLAYIYAAQTAMAKRLLDRALAMAKHADDELAVGFASLGLLWHQAFWVEPTAAQQEEVHRLASLTIGIGQRHQNTWLRVTATYALALDAIMHGNPREIRRRASMLLDLHRETMDARAKALSLVVCAQLSAHNFDYEDALQQAQEALGLLLTPMDRMHVECIKGVAQAMTGRGAEACRVLETIRQHSLALDTRITCLLVDPPIGIAQVVRGDIGMGIRWLEQTMDRFTEWGFGWGEANAHMYLGEIYTRLATDERRVDLSLIWRNISFLIRTLPLIRRRARYHLQRSIELNRKYNAPSYEAWSLLNLGLLESRRQPSLASDYLAKARVLAISVDATALVQRIDAALKTRTVTARAESAPL